MEGDTRADDIALQHEREDRFTIQMRNDLHVFESPPGHSHEQF